jgi:hypothetical protein
LETAVGALLETVASVPTMALKVLVGAGIKAIYNPWIKLGGGSKKENNEKGVEGEKPCRCYRKLLRTAPYKSTIKLDRRRYRIRER